jgi:hypothetical protein
VASLGVAFAQTLLEHGGNQHLLDTLRQKADDRMQALNQEGDQEAALDLSFFVRALHDKNLFPQS